MRELTKKAVPIAAAIAVLMVSGAAGLRAQNLIQNGGFDEGTPIAGGHGPIISPSPDWTLNLSPETCTGNGAGQDNGDPWFGPVGTGVSGDWGYRSPGYAMLFGAWNPPCFPSQSQSFGTVAGQTYTLDFYMQMLQGWGDNSGNLFDVLINGGSLTQGPQFISPGLSSWTLQEYTFQAATDVTTLSFAGSDTQGAIMLDDVSVTSVTPEPASLMLLATGLLGMGGVMRFRRKKNA